MSAYERSPRPADIAAEESAGTSGDRRNSSARHDQPGTDPHLLARVPDLDAGSRGRFDRESPRSDGSKSLGQRLAMGILVGGGLILVAVALGSWMFDSKSDDTAGAPPKWETEKPAPDAPVAPAWAGSGVSETAASQPYQPAAPEAMNPVIPAVPSYGGVPMDPAAQLPAAPQWNSGELPTVPYQIADPSAAPAGAERTNQALNPPAVQPAWSDPPAGAWPQPVDVGAAGATQAYAAPPAGAAPAPVIGAAPSYEPVYQAARPNPGYYADYNAAPAAPAASAAASSPYPQTSPTTYPNYDPTSQAYMSPNQPASYNATADYQPAPAAVPQGNYPAPTAPNYSVPIPQTTAPAYYPPSQPAYSPPAGQAPAYSAPAASGANYGQPGAPYGAAPATYSAPSAYPATAPGAAYPAAPYGAGGAPAYSRDARLEGTLQTSPVGTNYDRAGSSLR